MRFQLAEILLQDFRVAGMQFEQAQAILVAHEFFSTIRRTRVVAHLAARVERLDQLHVLRRRLGQVLPVP